MHRVRIHWALPFFKHEHMTLFGCFIHLFLEMFRDFNLVTLDSKYLYT